MEGDFGESDAGGHGGDAGGAERPLGIDERRYGERKELAQELHYSGDTNESASMNVWLHKQVMRKLAENGGKVPEELKA